LLFSLVPGWMLLVRVSGLNPHDLSELLFPLIDLLCRGPIVSIS